jgi:hypothetical protein
MPRPHDGRRAQTIRIYVRHHNDPAGKFTPREVECQDYEDGKGVQHKGCGARVQRFLTYPNQKAMRFDGPPAIVEGSQVTMGDGGIVVEVTTQNVHYATCAAKKAEEPQGSMDFRPAAGGR